MALRKYQATTNKDEIVVTTGDGHTIVRGRSVGGGGEGVTVEVGTTTTGEPDTEASVVNSGTETELVLDFTIPKGADGDNGTNGTNAVNPNFTADYETMNPEQSPSVDLTGTYPNLLLHFRIPRGRDGAGTISVGDTTTLPSGSNAYVTNTGTPENAVLNFGIPRGADGTGGGYDDAPYDGVYGKTGNMWVLITTGGGGTGIEEPPNDGNVYGRRYGEWVLLS